MSKFTREDFIALINREDEVAAHAIGRALVHLLKRQTQAEQDMNSTTNHNLRGFTPADAYKGSLTAKYYIKNKRLLDWQIDMWRKPNVKGVPRIAKYWKQMAEEVEKKKAA